MRGKYLLGLVVVGLMAAGCGSSSSGGTATPGGQGGTPAKPVDRVLFTQDFEGLCSGAPQQGAADYDKSVAGIHPVVGFSSSTIDADASKLSEITIPEGFTRRWAEGKNNLAEVELVVCAKRVKDSVVKTCTGYQKDGKDTGQVVTLHNASYQVDLYAAKTGEKIASKAIEAKTTDCPTLIMGDRKDDYASVQDAVVEFVQPHVKTGQ
jgi:hypothetical protein